MTVTRARDAGGWERIDFACSHGTRYRARGIPSVIDEWERSARINPCKLAGCPQRYIPPEES